jgi:hypothetical protein
MAGVHDYAKVVKRGHGRATDHASQDVRAGLMTREEGFEIAKKIDFRKPGALQYYLQISGLTEKEFIRVCKMNRRGTAKKLP